ncbi:MAG: hypothetical protein J7M08_04715 [Planctomycetes bacterium]|nr:hypothetical protein [Planctomycetota bacterium]
MTLSIRQHAAGRPLADKAAQLLARTIRERTGQVPVEGAADFAIHLDLEPGIGKEGFRIEDAAGGVRIAGNDGRGLIYGVGKFLRTSRLEDGKFTPGAWRGESVPEKPVRGIYFATHFHNFHHVAPVEKVERYVEELALWGCNALNVWFDMHHYNGIEDPAAQDMIARLHRILRAAGAVGMGATLGVLANEGYNNSPEELRADLSGGHDGYHTAPGGYWREVCPSRPGGLDYILRTRSEMLDAFADVDVEYMWIWPYDQGGCTCSKCAPWGFNGYLRCAEPLAEMVRERWPEAKIVLSTWYFDRFTTGEWEGLSRKFADGAPEWIDYLLIDDFSGFPAYPLEHGIPGGLPAVSFPEISMCGNMMPWGGYGAHPRPQHWQDYWNGCSHLIEGIFPYSEGIYEDINKAVLLQLCWEGARDVRDIVREYVGELTGPDSAGAVAEAVFQMEESTPHELSEDFLKLVRGPEQAKKSLTAETLRTMPLYRIDGIRNPERYAEVLRAAEGGMPAWARQAWRWRLLRARAELDCELHASGGLPTEETETIFAELADIYHDRNVEPNVYLMIPAVERLLGICRPED